MCWHMFSNNNGMVLSNPGYWNVLLQLCVQETMCDSIFFGAFDVMLVSWIRKQALLKLMIDKTFIPSKIIIFGLTIALLNAHDKFVELIVFIWNGCFNDDVYSFNLLILMSDLIAFFILKNTLSLNSTI